MLKKPGLGPAVCAFGSCVPLPFTTSNSQGGKGYFGFQVKDRRIFLGLKFSPFSPKSPVFKDFR